MLVCTKCGKQNALGRVFCEGCGNKLDLRNMAQQDISDNQQKDGGGGKLILWVVGAVVVGILVAIGLALWPKSGVIGEEGTRLGGRRVEISIRSFNSIRPGMELGREFIESDLNGYLANFGIEAMKVQSASVQLEEGYFFVRVVHHVGSIPLVKFEIPIRLSYDLACVPADARIKVHKASVGHLPLFGPAKTFAVNAVHNRLKGIKEWSLMQELSEITVEKGKVSILYKK